MVDNDPNIHDALLGYAAGGRVNRYVFSSF